MRVIAPILPFVDANILEQDVEDQVLSRNPISRVIDFADETIELRLIEQLLRETNHEPACAPVRQIEMQIEPALHELVGFPLEVSPFVMVRERGDRDLCPRRYRSQILTVLLGEGTFNRLELVVLILAHYCI